MQEKEYKQEQDREKLQAWMELLMLFLMMGVVLYFVIGDAYSKKSSQFKTLTVVEYHSPSSWFLNIGKRI